MTERSHTSPGGLVVQTLPGGGVVLAVSGDWTLPHYSALRHLIERLPPNIRSAPIDFAALGDLDTSGATLIARLLGPERLRDLATHAAGISAERRDLLRTVGQAAGRSAPPERLGGYIFGDVLARTGRATVAVWRNTIMLLSFTGRTLVTFALAAPRPRRWRLTAFVAQVEQTGLNAVPIVALLSFLVGAVVALLGATVLEDFGATIFTVDLVAYAFFREFGVLLAAVMLAGRTASAFTAQIGSMKAHEEIDALRVQGLDPVEILVLPRVLALLLTLPLLTFIAVLAGLFGGGVVAFVSLEISPARFLDILHTVPLSHFLVGLSKAPLFAFIIALIGCLEGFKAAPSAESVGFHTTSSVVQSIFLVILLDAVAALFFMEMDW